MSGNDSMKRADLEKTFAMSMAPLQRSWRRLIDKSVRRSCGYSFALVSPLLALTRHGDGQRHGALADRVGIEAPSLVRLVSELEARNLVLRRDLESDGRVKTIHLTEDGKALAREIEAVLAKLRREVLAGIGDEALQQGIAVMEAMGAGVARVDGDQEG